MHDVYVDSDHLQVWSDEGTTGLLPPGTYYCVSFSDDSCHVVFEREQGNVLLLRLAATGWMAAPLEGFISTPSNRIRWRTLPETRIALTCTLINNDHVHRFVRNECRCGRREDAYYGFRARCGRALARAVEWLRRRAA